MPQRYMLDTDTCIYVIKNKPRATRKRFESAKADDLVISAVTWGELEFGAPSHK